MTLCGSASRLRHARIGGVSSCPIFDAQFVVSRKRYTVIRTLGRTGSRNATCTCGRWNLFISAQSGHRASIILSCHLRWSIYVGDFKLAGLKKNLPLRWMLLRQGLHIEPEQRVGEKGAVYLGCRHVVSSITLPNRKTAATMTYDMEDFLKSCIDKYREAVGPKVSLSNYSIPFLPEVHRDSPAGAPGSGPVRECPWCFHTGPPTSFPRILLRIEFLFVVRQRRRRPSGLQRAAMSRPRLTARRTLTRAFSICCVQSYYESSTGCATCSPRSISSSDLPRDQSVDMDVHMLFCDAPIYGIYTIHRAFENDRVDW